MGWFTIVMDVVSFTWWSIGWKWSWSPPCRWWTIDGTSRGLNHGTWGRVMTQMTKSMLHCCDLRNRTGTLRSLCPSNLWASESTTHVRLKVSARKERFDCLHHRAATTSRTLVNMLKINHCIWKPSHAHAAHAAHSCCICEAQNSVAARLLINVPSAHLRNMTNTRWQNGTTLRITWCACAKRVRHDHT